VVALPVWAGAKAAAPAMREAMMADFILTVLRRMKEQFQL
jgi:hypothetical protein